ncbi:MAG: universal stress protein [Rhodocyclaceae bacterium]|nr:universal stress protein [Rhodocyclaceae bacterium]
MQKLLIPVDGSAHACRAVQDAIAQLQGGAALELHLLNVQPALDGLAQSFVRREDLDAYRREEAAAALASARGMLDAAGIAHVCHVAVGRTADTILRFIEEKGMNGVLMGSHGHGNLLGALLGSVAREVSARAQVPVRLVK